jgi:hypothetical protein
MTLRASDLPANVRRQLTRRLSESQKACHVKHSPRDNLSGSLFPTREGVQLTPRSPLKLKQSALSPAQLTAEDRHLMDFVSWSRDWGRRYPALWHAACFHAQNEGALSAAQAAKQMAMGKKAGVSDWLNLLPGRALAENFSFLSIEFKVREKDLRDPQRDFFDSVVAARGSAHVVWCKPEAALVTLWYFGLAGDRNLLLSAGDPAVYLVPRLGGHDERCPCGLKIVGSLRAMLKLKE